MTEKANKTIIVVDDDPADALFAMQIIKKHKVEYKVLFFDEGTAVLDFFNTEVAPSPSAIFIDIHMPNLGGLDVLRKLKKNNHAADIPVIMLTSSLTEQDITESYRLGAYGYIVKPLNPQKFLETLDNLGIQTDTHRQF